MYNLINSLITQYILGIGHSKHCPDEANDTADNSKQHCSKDNNSSLTDSSSQ